MDMLILKLKKLKKIVKDWIRKKEEEDRRSLVQVENQIMEIMLRNMDANLSAEERVLMSE